MMVARILQKPLGARKSFFLCGFLAFEIKRSQQVSHHDAKGLKSFKKDFPEAQLFLIHGGKHHLHFEDVQAVPLADALEALPGWLGI